jgi:superfamily II DNA or RNA helicase
LNKFKLFIGDEAHHFQAKSFMKFMEMTTDIQNKFGFTGTIDSDSECNVMVLTGLFGSIERLVTTKELMDQGFVTPIKIKAIVLQYKDETKKLIQKKIDNKKVIEYIEEIKFLETYTKRNNFIKNLVVSLEGNSLIFFQHKDHGELLYSMIRDEMVKLGRHPNDVFLSHGTVKGKIRDDIKPAFENGTGKIGVTSYGTFQTSISIKNIHNMIFACPSKSLIRVLQSIGRGLRLHESKKVVTLFDISDNMILGNMKNHTIKHFKIRMDIYAKENFKVKIYNVGLEN